MTMIYSAARDPGPSRLTCWGVLAVLLLGTTAADAGSSRCGDAEHAVRLLDAETRKPIQGVIANALRADTGAPLEGVPPVRSDAAGLLCVPAGTEIADLRLSHPDYRKRSLVANDGLADSSREATILLSPLALLSLTIRAEDRPLARARVAWRTASMGDGDDTGGDDGNWRRTVGIAGENLLLAVGAEGFAPTCVQIQRLRAGTQTLDVVVRRSASLSIDVRGASDQLLADVSLRWVQDAASSTCPSDMFPADWPGRERTVKADGATWRLERAPPGRGALLVSAAGQRQARVGPIYLPPGAHLDLGVTRLLESRAVTGIVESEEGEGLEDVVVKAVNPLAWDGVVAETATGDGGRFDLDCGDWRQVAVVAGETPGPVARVETVRPDDRTLRLTLPAASSISGAVRTSSGTPVAGAEVIVRPLESCFRWNEGVARFATSDDDGKFLASDLGAGVWRVDVRADGFTPFVAAPVEIEVGETVNVDAHMVPALLLEGTVLDQTDLEPVDGATVRRVSSVESESCAVTDERGRFSLELPGGQSLVVATHPEVGQKTLRVDPEAGPVHIVLVPGGAVEGQAVSARGLPDPDRLVEVPRLGLSTRTGPDGSYRLDNVPAGPHRVVLSRHALLENRLVESRDVEVLPGETVRADFFGGTSVEGQVVVDGAPGASMRVVFARMNEGRASGNLTDTVSTAVTDENGNYALDGLRPGTYTATASWEGGSDHRTANLVEGRVNVVDFSICGAEIEGIVVDEQSGEPISGAAIEVFDPSLSFGVVKATWRLSNGDAVSAGQVSGWARSAISGFDGTFRLLAPAGRLSVHAGAPGYRPVQRGLNLQEDERASVRLELQRSWSVTGIVRSRRGHPVFGAGVLCSCGSVPAVVNTFTDEEGLFEVSGLEPQSCTLVAQQGGDAIGTAIAMPVPGGESAFTEVLLQGPGRLRVRLSDGEHGNVKPVLLDGSGFPVDSLLALSGFPGVHPFESRDEEDRTVVVWPSLPVGHYVVLLPEAGKSVPVYIQENQETELQLGR